MLRNLFRRNILNTAGKALINRGSQFSFSKGTALLNQIAIITGGANGIGKASARRFLQEGAKVVIADISKDVSKDTVKQLRKDCKTKNIVFKQTDTGNEKSIKDLMDFTYNKFGAINILVNNATAFIHGTVAIPGDGSQSKFYDRYNTDEEWATIWKVNILGYIKCIQHVVPYMKKNDLTNVIHYDEQNLKRKIHAGSRGSIINVSSVQGFISFPEFLPYNTSKAAELQINKNCAQDLSKYKIRVNAVSPGDVYTLAYHNELKKMVNKNMTYEEAYDLVCEGQNWFGRIAAPYEMASVVNFLASDEASFMTGENIVVDAGRTVGR